ncbi:MAG: glycosyltransferase family 39 protein [Anaerolineae bacterium]|nr:glycosyltransferase family 39 protein [Anaerolineae bacterium]
MADTESTRCGTPGANRARWAAALVTMTFFALAVTYSVVTPIFESPDESWHYAYVQHIADTGALPVQDVEQAQPWAHEGSQAPLYYLLAGLLTAPIQDDDLASLLIRNPHADVGIVTPDGNANMFVHTERERWPWRGAILSIHVARILSALLATGTVLTVYALGRVMWPRRPVLSLVAMTFVAFNPMFLFIAGSVNNDNLVTLAASLTLWQLACLMAGPPHEPPAWRHAILGLLAGLTALSKLSGVMILPLVLLALLWRGIGRRSWRTALLGNALVGVTAVVVAGWWYTRNAILYQDWTGIQPILSIMSPRAFTPTFYQWFVESSGFLRSLWGVFGHFSILMPSAAYVIFYSTLAIGSIGLLVSFWRGWWRGQPPHMRQTWGILLLWCGLVLAALIRFTLLIPSSQGRLFFPAIVPLALLWTAGWTGVLSSRLRLVPALVMFPLAVWVPFGVIAPAYAHPASISELPPTARPIEIVLGEEIRLLGYQVSQQDVEPGDTLTVHVYWRCEQPVVTDYSVFLQLLDPYDLIVAQRDVYPGPGTFPTGEWKAGEQFRDTYTLRLPATAPAPTKARLIIGLYDHTTGARLPVSTGDDSVSLGEIAIQPHRGERPNALNLRFRDGIALVGYTIKTRQVVAGDSVTLCLKWQARGTPSAEYKIFVHLLDDMGERITQDDRELEADFSQDQTVVSNHSLQVPVEASAGGYRLIVGLYRPDNGQRLTLLYNNGQPVQAEKIFLCRVRVLGVRDSHSHQHLTIHLQPHAIVGKESLNR